VTEVVEGRAGLRPGWIGRLLPALGVSLFAAALWILHRELSDLHPGEVLDQLHALPASSLAAAIGLTVVSYLVLTLYDMLGARYAGAPVPYPRSALAAFLGYAFTNTMGMSGIGGATLRVRLYSSWGLSAVEIASLVGFIGFTFWLGLLSLGGVVFLIVGGRVPPELHLPVATLRPLGAVFVGLVVAYAVACAVTRRPFRFGRWVLQTPRLRLVAGQVAVSSLDWAVSAAVLWVLLPDRSAIDPLHFLAVYLLAQTAGLLSQVPGGLGVFETVVVLLVPSATAGGGGIAALLAYRLIYYLLPFVLSVAVLGAWELRGRIGHLERLPRGMAGALTSVAPHVLGAATFVAGGVLLVSGATPVVPERILVVRELLPLPLLELSHFLGSIVGVALLLLAYGLWRRLAVAWAPALSLLLAGSLLSLAKGFDWEEATVLAVLAVILIPARSAFYRRARLVAEPLSPGWTALVVMVLIGAAWLGLFAYRHVDYSSELWWRFAFDADAPRFLRAGVGVAVAAVVIGVWRLLGPAPPDDHPPSPTELDLVRDVVAASPRASAGLALLGDKRFLLSDSGEAFVMYGVAGRSWISMGDPVGSREERPELVWRFHALADRHGGWTVFYEVGPDALPIYLELGLSALKIGEEAVVDLGGFSLEGSDHKYLRHAARKLEREGCGFEVVPPEGVTAVLPELREISDEWLIAKATREKGFSLGRFEEAYVSSFPVAVVRRGGRIEAFATVWRGADRGELSLDLMRYRTDAPSGVMDFLISQLMLWGREGGWGSFTLGMAPLAGLEGGPLATAWSRFGSAVYHWGDHFYSFDGLRRYKQKFGPVWQPRYLMCPGGRAVPVVLADLATLVSGGVFGAVMR